MQSCKYTFALRDHGYSPSNPSLEIVFIPCVARGVKKNRIIHAGDVTKAFN